MARQNGGCQYFVLHDHQPPPGVVAHEGRGILYEFGTNVTFDIEGRAVDFEALRRGSSIGTE